MRKSRHKWFCIVCVCVCESFEENFIMAYLHLCAATNNSRVTSQLLVCKVLCAVRANKLENYSANRLMHVGKCMGQMLIGNYFLCKLRGVFLVSRTINGYLRVSICLKRCFYLYFGVNLQMAETL